VGAVKNALTNLPCVDPSSVKVDITTKEARFKPAEGEKVDVEKVKEAVAGAGNYTVTAVKPPDKAEVKPADKN
jgi:copper chaperone CopZ